MASHVISKDFLGFFQFWRDRFGRAKMITQPWFTFNDVANWDTLYKFISFETLIYNYCLSKIDSKEINGQFPKVVFKIYKRKVARIIVIWHIHLSMKSPLDSITMKKQTHKTMCRVRYVKIQGPMVDLRSIFSDSIWPSES